jgi:hypothetical protein
VLDLSTLGAANQILSITFNSGNDEAGTVSFVGGETLSFSEMEHVICFAKGSLIRTASGDRPVEGLQPGDRVETLDHGLQPIRWIGTRQVPAIRNLAPIVIGAGAMDNDRDLIVSPQHRILVTGWRAEMLFGEPEVLVAAKHLVDGDKIYRASGGQVTYFHICFDRHEIIFAENQPTESFLPGPMGAKTLHPAQLAELFEIFPELQQDLNAMPPARPSLRRAEARLLAEGTHLPPDAAAARLPSYS